MKAAFLRNRTFLAVLMGLLTTFFCLYLADGVFGMQGLKITEFVGESPWSGPIYNKSVDRNNQIGSAVFIVFAIGIPLLFSHWIGFRDTFVNALLYPFGWGIIDEIVGSHPGHMFLFHGSSGFLNIKYIFLPIQWTLVIFLIQGAVFAYARIVRESKNT